MGQNVLREVHLEVGHRHLAAAEEGDRRGEDAQHHERASDELDDARRARQRGQGDDLAAEETEELLQPVEEEQQSRDDSEQRVHVYASNLANGETIVPPAGVARRRRFLLPCRRSRHLTPLSQRLSAALPPLDGAAPVLDPVSRTGSVSTRPIAGVCQLTLLEREAATSNALGQAVPEALELGNALVDHAWSTGPRASPSPRVRAPGFSGSLPSSVPTSSSDNPIR